MNNERLRKELENAAKLVRKMEERLWKENIRIDKEKENHYMVKMMEEIEEALKRAKEDEVKKKERQDEDFKFKIEQDRQTGKNK